MSENQGAPQGAAQSDAGVQQHDGGAAVAERIAAIEERGTRTLTGRVVSTKMQKTVAVEIVRLIRHMPYGKFIRRTTKLLAHDESSQSKQGDLVAIAPCRPLSRRKSWRVIEVLEKAAP
jgi:small subunit ribosomal protein S17